MPKRKCLTSARFTLAYPGPRNVLRPPLPNVPKAGIENAPRTWDELRAAARKMQGGGIYGAPLPYAKNSMTTLVFICFVRLAGGQVFSPDLEVAIDSKESLNALEFYKSMRELCPAWPPVAWRSTSTVRRPSDAPYTAEPSPAGPPPMTMRS